MNKVSSRAELRVHVGRAEGSAAHSQPHISPHTFCIDKEVFEQLKALAGSRISSRGDLIITSQEYRSLALNREACEAKLRALLGEAVAAAGRPHRIVSVLPEGVVESMHRGRRREKEARGQRKQGRKPVQLPPS